MRIVAWNLGHQTRPKAIKPEFRRSLALLRPDVLILNEYVHGDMRETLLNDLRDQGLTSYDVSVRTGKNNQVLLASRYAFDLGELRGVPTNSGGGESNFLHVILRESQIEIVGMRVPAYRGAVLKDYWTRFDRLARAVRHRPIVFCGDLNVDPDGATSVGQSVLSRLRQDGWNMPSPQGDWSFKSGSRIDHAVSSPGLPIIAARYCAGQDGVVFCSNIAPAISDHTPLIIDL